MKAEVNGIKLEGTPREIYEFLELRMKNEKVKFNLDKPFNKKPSNPYSFDAGIMNCSTTEYIKVDDYKNKVLKSAIVNL